MKLAQQALPKISALALVFAASASTEAAAPAAPSLTNPPNGASYDKAKSYLTWSASGATGSRIVFSSDQNFSNFVDANGASYCTDTTNCFTTTTGTATFYQGNIPLGGPLWWKVRINTSQGVSVFSAPRKLFVNPCLMTGAPKYSKQQIGTDYVFQVNICSGADLRAFTEPKSGTYSYKGQIVPDVFTFPARTVKNFIANNPNTVGLASLVVSGSFHNDGGVPVFPQLIDGAMRTIGGDLNSPLTYPKRNLSINHTQKRVAVFAWTTTTLADIKAKAGQADIQTIVTGLDPSEPKSPPTPFFSGIVGRNFACVTNPYSNAYGTVIFAVSPGALSSKISSLLSDTYKCSASNIIQFDGSTTAQAAEKFNGTWSATKSYLVNTTRMMPQIFYVK